MQALNQMMIYMGKQSHRKCNKFTKENEITNSYMEMDHGMNWRFYWTHCKNWGAEKKILKFKWEKVVHVKLQGQ